MTSVFNNQNSSPHMPKQDDPNTSSVSLLSNLIQENTTKSNAIQIPQISLPRGGGALKGIDEKFQVNSANGTASFSISLPLTPSRNNFSPSLSLNYNSGGGNSPYGLGWSVDYPTFQRKTDKRLPRYREALEEDVFMFSGAEDLVPFLAEQPDGNWQQIVVTSGNFQAKRYRRGLKGILPALKKSVIRSKEFIGK